MTEKNEALHIHELRGDNFKRLKHFAVKLQPGVTQVTGKNGAGKSTFLDVVRHLLGDAKQHSAEVIRRGEESCQLVGDLGDFVVERRWRKNEKGAEVQTVVLKAKDGRRLDSPQAVLDSFYSTYTFDPLAFARLKPDKQLEELRALVGIDTGPLDGRRQDLYEQRTDLNRKVKDRGARLRAMTPPPKDLPEKPIDVDDLLRQQNVATNQRIENNQQRNRLSFFDGKLKKAEEDCAAFKNEIVRLENNLAQAKTQLVDAAGRLEEAAKLRAEFAEQVAALKDPDAADLNARISAAQATNMAISRAQDRKKLELELKAVEDEEAQLTGAIEQLDKDKAKLIADAKFPVPGLSFGDAGVLLNDFPYEQASAAEKMRVSTAIGFARNPRLKFMAIHDGSLLDDESLKLLEQLCGERNGQLLIERVGTDSDVGIVVDDGEIVPVRAVKGQQDLGIALEGRGPDGAA